MIFIQCLFFRLSHFVLAVRLTGSGTAAEPWLKIDWQHLSKHFQFSISDAHLIMLISPVSIQAQSLHLGLVSTLTRLRPHRAQDPLALGPSEPKEGRPKHVETPKHCVKN